MKSSIVDGVFWLLCLGVFLLNVMIFRWRVSEYTADDTQLRAEGNTMLRVTMQYLGALFVVGAIGAALGLSGGLLTPMSGRRGVLSWFDIAYLIAYVLVFLRATWWVFAEGGAERLADHHEMFRFAPSSKLGVMLLWAALMLALGYGCIAASTEAA